MACHRARDRRLVDLLVGSTGKAVDLLYCSAAFRLGGGTPYFHQGWGDLGVVDFNEDAKAYKSWPPSHFDLSIEWKKKHEGRQKASGICFELLEGTFRTPCLGRIYDALPEESRTARAQLLLPRSSPAADACVLHLAATGDQTFKSRVALGAPLLAKGIATMVLESPFYGRRAPSVQKGSRLQHVSDLLTLGRSTIEESLALLNWASMQGFTKLGMSGFSMGGVHASMVAALYPFPLACTPLLAPRSAAVAYCQGALALATDWRSLLQQVDAKGRDVNAMIMAAAQPNAVTGAALRVLQNPRLHTPPKLYLDSNDSSSPQSASHPSNDSASLPPQQQWQTKHLPARNADSGSVTASSIERNRSADTYGQSQSDKQKHKGWLLTKWPHISWTKLHGVSESQAARGQTPWRGFERLGLDAGRRMMQDWWLDKHRVQKDAARLHLEQVLETYTDVTRFPPPQCPEAAVVVGALQDQYVPPNSVADLADHWPGSDLRWVSGGHVTAFLLQQTAFRRAIVDSLERLPKWTWTASSGRPEP